MGHTNVTVVNMYPLLEVILGLIWKHTVEKSQTSANSVTMLPLKQVIWGHIWKCTVEKSQTNAANATLPLLGQTIWEHIWQRTVETNLNKYSKCDFACSDPSSLNMHFKKWQFVIVSKTSDDSHKSITNVDNWNLNCIKCINSFIFGRDKLIFQRGKKMADWVKNLAG